MEADLSATAAQVFPGLPLSAFTADVDLLDDAPEALYPVIDSIRQIGYINSEQSLTIAYLLIFLLLHELSFMYMIGQQGI